MPVKKAQDRWGEAHIRLRKLFEERAGMSQLEFAERYGLGTQGMVWQYLSGYRPLNYEAAAKFARGLHCTIYDICPEMANAIKDDILPVLGKATRRAAAIILALALQPAHPDAYALATSHNAFSDCGYFSKALNTIHIVSLSMFRRFRDWAIGHTLQMFRMA